MLVAAGIVFGCALGSYERTTAAAPVTRNADEQETDLVEQLKEIKTQVKQINTLLRNGNVKVVVLMNPDAKR